MSKALKADLIFEVEYINARGKTKRGAVSLSKQPLPLFILGSSLGEKSQIDRPLTLQLRVDTGLDEQVVHWESDLVFSTTKNCRLTY